MVAMVVILLPLVLLVGAFTTAMNARSKRLRNEIADSKALQAAEAAIDEAVFRADTGTLVSGSPFARDLGRGCSFRAEPTHLGSDAADNDGDGEVDEDDEDVFRLVVTGSYCGVDRRLAAYLGPVSWLPSLGAAVTVANRDVQLRLDGTPSISGFDHALDGTRGDPAKDATGIAVVAPGTVTDLTATLDATEATMITGAGGVPSLGVAPPLDLSAMVVAVQNSADVVMTNARYGSVHFGNAATRSAHITYRDGDLKIAGNSRGAGILLVTGDLEVAGTFRFDGVVIVLGELRTSAGTADIYGSVVFGPSSPGLRTTGTAAIRYSADAVALAQQRSGRYVAFNGWQELARR